MTAAFLVALVLSLSLRLWLSRRQVAHVLAHRGQVPRAFSERIPLDAHQKAADYTVTRQLGGRVALLVRAALLVLWTIGGGIEWLGRHLGGAWFLLAAFGLTGLAMLPFTIYSVFRIEERFGFNRTTPRLFVVDTIKSIVLGVALGWPIATGVLWLIAHGGTYWFLWAWAGWVVFVLFLTWVYPAFIAPLFNKFTPLEDAELRARIEDLLRRTGFSSGGLFVMDGSRRSTHANAYFTGWGGKKRVVLYDTLCDMLDPPEIEAVLAHEIGHYRRRHIWKRLGAAAVQTALGLLLVDALIARNWFYSGLGVETVTHAAGLLLVLWVSPLFLFPLNPLWSAWSRRHEYEADAFAAEHSSAASLIGALTKMYEKNAATLTPDPLHSAYHDSHPPATLRIARLEG